MIPTVVSTSEVVGSLDAEEMTLHLTPQLFRMISTSIYECRERAIIQELVANSLDACKTIGSTAPIEITLPTSASPQLTVLDHGVGMDLDVLMKSALAYGNSTKTLDNLAVGGFGIGLKSVFSISDSVTVTTVKDGYKHVAIGMMLDGIPVHKHISSEPTEETSGTAVVLPCPEAYFSKLRDVALSAFTHWTHDVKVDGRKVNTSPLYLSKENPVAVSPAQSSYSHDIRVCIGGFMLNVSPSMTGLDLANYERLLGHRQPLSVTIFADIGELEIAPSRERIEYTASNTELLQDRIDAYFAEWRQSIDRHVVSVLAFAEEHRELLHTVTLQNYSQFQSAASKLRCIIPKDDLRVVIQSLRRQRRVALANVLSLYDTKGFADSFHSSIYPKAALLHNLAEQDIQPFRLVRNRNGRYASRQTSLSDEVLTAMAELITIGSTDWVFVVTELGRPTVSRFVNHCGESSLKLRSTSGDTTSALMRDIVFITPEEETSIQYVVDELAALHVIQMPFYTDSALQDVRANALHEARVAAPQRPATRAARTDVETQVLTVKFNQDSTGQFDGVSVPEAAVAQFYDTIENFVQVCPHTGRARLLVIGSSAELGTDAAYSADPTIKHTEIVNIVAGSDLHKSCAEIVILLSPSVSQQRSKRTMLATEKFTDDNLLFVASPASFRTWVLDKTSEDHKELMFALNFVNSIGHARSESAVARQLPTGKLRRLYLSASTEERAHMLKICNNYTNSVHAHYKYGRGLPQQLKALYDIASDCRYSYSSMTLDQSLEGFLRMVRTMPPMVLMSQYGLVPEKIYRKVRITLNQLIEYKLNSLRIAA